MLVEEYMYWNGTNIGIVSDENTTFIENQTIVIEQPQYIENITNITYVTNVTDCETPEALGIGSAGVLITIIVLIFVLLTVKSWIKDKF